MASDMIDKIVAAFDVFCKTGKAELSETQVGYLMHAIGKAKRNAGNYPVLAVHHPLFMLMAFTNDPVKIVPFVEAVIDRKQ